jgi:hypothetical protein
VVDDCVTPDNDTSYAVDRFTLAWACGRTVLPHFLLFVFARSAKTNNDRKKTYRAAAGDDRIRSATA